MPVTVGNVLVWDPELDGATIAQASRAASLPFIAGHVALMPDAHVGLGSAVGTVIPTSGAIIPAAVGVDIGCGMIAVETNLDAGDLPDDLGNLLSRIERAGRGRPGPSDQSVRRHNAPSAAPNRVDRETARHGRQANGDTRIRQSLRGGLPRF